RTLAPGKINEDVVVPVSRIPALVAGVGAISREQGLPLVCFGHAGNGNLHVNILFDPTDPARQAAAERALSEVFALAIGLGGTLSGEHGIGLAKRDFMAGAVDPAALALMRQVKAIFDPDGILNPGKLLPSRPGQACRPTPSRTRARSARLPPPSSSCAPRCPAPRRNARCCA